MPEVIKLLLHIPLFFVCYKASGIIFDGTFRLARPYVKHFNKTLYALMVAVLASTLAIGFNSKLFEWFSFWVLS